MNTKLIKRVINTTIESGVKQLQVPQGANPESYWSKYNLNNNVSLNGNNIDELVKTLKQEPELHVIENAELRKGNNSTRLTIKRLALWLLAQTFLHGNANKPLKILSECVKRNSAKAYYVAALVGIKVKEKVKLAKNIYLLPFESLYPSAEKDRLIENVQYGMDNHVHFDPMPTAALMHFYIERPLFRKNMPKQETRGTLDYFSAIYNRTTKLENLLTIVGPCSPAMTRSWNGFIKPVPLSYQWLGTCFRGSDIYPKPMQLSKMENAFCSEKAIKLCQAFEKMPVSERSKLDVPLTRLNSSSRRTRDLDRIIDLGIAMESLLLDKKDPDVSIGYLFRQRGCYLHCSKVAERDITQKLLRDLYMLRSIAVHTGKLKEKEKKMDRKSDEIINDGIRLCAELIEKIVIAGKKPDWDKLVLSDPK